MYQPFKSRLYQMVRHTFSLIRVMFNSIHLFENLILRSLIKVQSTEVETLNYIIKICTSLNLPPTVKTESVKRSNFFNLCCSKIRITLNCIKKPSTRNSSLGTILFYFHISLCEILRLNASKSSKFYKVKVLRKTE